MKEESPQQENEIKELIKFIKDWFKYFSSYWKSIVLLIVVFACISLFRASLVKTLYTAEYTIAIDEKGSATVGSAGLASQLGFDIGGASGGMFSGENNIELLRSRRLIENTLLTVIEVDGKRELLVDRYVKFNKLDKNWDDEPGLREKLKFDTITPREKLSRQQNGLLFQIYKSIRNTNFDIKKQDKKLAIITLRYGSYDEVFAKCFTEQLIENATTYYIKTKTLKYKRNVTILERRLDSVRNELNKEIYGIAIHKDRNTGVIRAKAGISEARSTINMQVLSAMFGELTKNLEMAKYSLIREEPIIQIIDFPVYPLESQRPGLVKATIIGGIIGFLIGIVYVILIRFIKEYF